jgi:hypothetical protein
MLDVIPGARRRDPGISRGTWRNDFWIPNPALRAGPE